LPRKAPTTVVLAHFDDVFGRGLRALIESDESLTLLAADVDQRRMSVVLRAHRPDVAILDVGALSKFAEIRELCARHPRTRLVLFADDPSMAVHAPLLAFGASGCLGRDTQSRDILNAIHLAARGMQVMPRAAPASAATPGPREQLLTPREAEVLLLLQQGGSNARIAAELHIGIETVRTHAHNLYGKLGVSSRRELVLPARMDGYASHGRRAQAAAGERR
jgi:DNA-binding NarL/FixJ family response regulator